jgi:hypothetical protein
MYDSHYGHDCLMIRTFIRTNPPWKIYVYDAHEKAAVVLTGLIQYSVLGVAPT